MIKILFFTLFVKPFIFLFLGINICNVKNLPKKGPAIIVANHSSHIDTLLLMSLFSIGMIRKVRPVAAADYFCCTKTKKFIFERFIGIVPISRHVDKKNVKHIFENIHNALKNKDIVILYPEGTRSLDDSIHPFKGGITHIVKEKSKIPIIPIYINGPGKILPKFEYLIVPFISDVYIGKPFYYDGKQPLVFAEEIREKVLQLKAIHVKKETL